MHFVFYGCAFMVTRLHDGMGDGRGLVGLIKWSLLYFFFVDEVSLFAAVCVCVVLRAVV